MDNSNKLKQDKIGSEILQNLKKLAPIQMLSLISMLLIGLTIPVTIFMALSPIKPIITPATGPVTPPDSPTPPVIGNIPVIITSNLPDVNLGRNYKQVVEGYDLDLGDELTYQAEGLPAGITLDQCRSNTRKIVAISKNNINYISCSLSGKTKEYGDFTIKLTLIDGFNFAQKTLQLKVK